MKDELLLAIDIGTTNTKGGVFTPKGEMKAFCEMRHAVSRPQTGWAEQDADEIWWKDTVKTCHELLKNGRIEAENIVSMCISTLFPTVLPVDGGMRPLRPAILYMDTRSSSEVDKLNEALGEGYAARVTGRPLTTMAAAPKMLWLKEHEPETFGRTAYYLTASSYLLYKLTGEIAADYSASKMSGPPFSLETFGWDERAAVLCGITAKQLPELKFSAQEGGRLTPEAAQATGLPEGITVSVGAGDFPAETLGNGVAHLKYVQLTYGSTMGVSPGNDHISLLFPDFDVESRMEQTKFRRGGAMYNGCCSVDWAASVLGDGENTVENIERLGEEASKIRAGSDGLITLPYLNGERIPFYNPDACGVIFGLKSSHTGAHIYRSVIEGLAYAVRHTVESFGCEDMKDAIALGGGTKNALLLQTVSDATGIRQTVLENVQGTLVGDAFMAGYACGMFTSKNEIDAWVKTGRIYTPNPENAGVYEEGYMKFRELYSSLSQLMSNIN